MSISNCIFDKTNPLLEKSIAQLLSTELRTFMNLWKILTRRSAQSARNMQSLQLVTIFRRWNNFLSMFQIFSYMYKNMNLPKYPQSAHHHIHFLFEFQIFKNIPKNVNLPKYPQSIHHHRNFFIPIPGF